MADTKVTGMSTGVPAVADVFPYVDIAGGNNNKKSTVASVIDKAVKVAGAAPAQAITAASDTYLTSSAIDVSGRLQVGSILKWRVIVTKTAAGVAAPAWNVRFGTAGTTSDTSRLALTGSTQTGAIDTGVFEIMVVVTAVGAATGVVRGFVMLQHNLGATGLGGAGTNAAAQASSGLFDTTTVGLKAGLSVNTGASAAWTVNLIFTEAYNLA
jgi:hypothetical protein